MSSITDEILAVESQRQFAFSVGDIETLGELMADDLVHVHTNGRCEDKREFINHFRGIKRRIERPDLTVRVYGDIAVVTGPMTNRTEQPNGLPKVAHLYVTQVLRRGDEGWKFVSFHASPLVGG